MIIEELITSIDYCFEDNQYRCGCKNCVFRNQYNCMTHLFSEAVRNAESIGKEMAAKKKHPPDYNSDFCLGDKDCVKCWIGWIEDVYREVSESG